jgi:hypothetical protein
VLSSLPIRTADTDCRHPAGAEATSVVIKKFPVILSAILFRTLTCRILVKFSNRPNVLIGQFFRDDMHDTLIVIGTRSFEPIAKLTRQIV